MNSYKLLKIFTLIACMTVGTLSFAQFEASIPLTDSRMPSDDLFYDQEILTSRDAYDLKMSGVDLSTLNPSPSALWEDQNQSTNEDILMDVTESDTAIYKAPLMSVTGLFRFNVRVDNKDAIVHLSKRLHTILLRKNILRLMGYKIPNMKWLPELTVSFESADQMDEFIDSQIPMNTLGAASRWLKNKDETALTITLKDIAVTIPSAADHYNLSLGVPPKSLTNRTMRSLIIPYAFLDLGESVNSFKWHVGRIENGNIILPHFTRGIYGTTFNDAKWSLKRLLKLNRENLHKAIKEAYFPKAVAKLLLEKLISRQNSLAELFSMEFKARDFDTKISYEDELEDGKITKEVWEDYGSRFAHGTPDSPFKDFHWYALAKIQALGIDNIIARANSELSFFDPNQVRSEFHKKQFEKGLHHFVETGEFLQFPVGSWISPIADINLIASRDVVVGNYLGTDNLVQLADTIGWGVEVGPKIGFENLAIAPTVGVQATNRLMKTWTHLKPLTSLKDAFKEPYKNIIVPLLKHQLARQIDKLHQLKDSNNPNYDWSLQEKDSPMAAIVSHLNKKLGVGESLIMSEKINPNIMGSLSTSLMGTPVHFSMTGGIDYVQIRRIQIYRKSADIFQIYDDVGNGAGWTLNVSLQRFIPIVRLTNRRQKGDYSVRLHEVNLNPELSENPKLFNKAHALSHFLQTGSSELLNAVNPPHIVEAEYLDKSSRFAFLFWRRNKLKADTEFDITTNNGLRGKYVTYTQERQTGINNEAFVKDLINYGLRRISLNARWAPPVWQNPAQTIGGIGNTKSIRYEARVNEENGTHDYSYMKFTEKYEGWSKKVASLKKKLKKINNKFGYNLFDQRSLNTLDGLKLYDISININLYDKAIENLKMINPDTLIVYEDQYEVERNLHTKGCGGSRIQTRKFQNGQTTETCGTFNSIISTNKKCQKLEVSSSDLKRRTKCFMTLFTNLYEKLPIEKIKSLLGEENLYIDGSINGFRKNDEKLNEPILSNSSGKIGSKYRGGPFEKIIQLLGIQSGEMNGHWLRDRL